MQRRAPIDILVQATNGSRSPDQRRNLGRIVAAIFCGLLVVFLALAWYPTSSDSRITRTEIDISSSTNPSTYTKNPSGRAPINPGSPRPEGDSVPRSLALKEPLADISKVKIYVYEDEFWQAPRWRDEVIECYDKFISPDPSNSIAENGGLGRKLSIFRDIGVQLWDTDPNGLEVYVYNRIVNSSLRTYNAEEADLFYVPYHVGLAKRCSRVKDRMPLPYEDVASNAAVWQRLRNSNLAYFTRWPQKHFFISHRSMLDIGSSFVDTGSHRPYFVATPERADFSSEGGAIPIGIPFLSGIHLNQYSVEDVPFTLINQGPREFLSCFVGDHSGPLRSRVSGMCEKHRTSCYHEVYNSSHPTEAEYVSAAYARARSTFCLEPHPGAQPLLNHRGIWDALAFGCVPVLFGERSIAQLPFPDLIDWNKLVLSFPETIEDVVESLKAIPESVMNSLQQEAIATLRHVQFSSDDDSQDAFSLFLRAMIKRNQSG